MLESSAALVTAMLVPAAHGAYGELNWMPMEQATLMLEAATTISEDLIEMPAEALHMIPSRHVIPGGTCLPEHKHPFPRYGCMFAGTLQVTSVESGDIVEDVARWHKARNVGDGPVELLIIDLVKPGHRNTVLKNAE